MEPKATLIVKPKPPYTITHHLKLFTIPGEPAPCICEDYCCRRLLGLLAFEACVSGEPENPVVRIRVYEGDPREAEQAVKHIYNTNLDYQDFLEKAKHVPKLHALALRARGARPALVPSLFEAIVKSIIQQQIPQRLALKITSKLIRAFGPHQTISGKTFYDFPSPSTLAQLSVEELRGVGLSARKAEYILDLSRRAERVYDIERIMRKDPETAASMLLEFRGVGSWTAKLSIMAATGQLVFSLIEDKSVARGLKRIGLTGEELSIVEERLREYIGLVMYLASLHH